MFVLGVIVTIGFQAGLLWVAKSYLGHWPISWTP